MKLSERAMLASLTIHRWQGTLTDRKITREVANAHSVSERRAGRYRKHAINIEAPTFKAVGSASNALRVSHYFYTLPWGQDGARILTATNFEKYSAEIRKLRGEFQSAVSEFVADYPQLREAARIELNSLYDEKDYPCDIESYFGVDLSIMPLPEAEDFRASLSQHAVAEIRGNIENELKRTTEAAMRDPYERLYTHIQRMVERLNDPFATFRDTLVSGLAELCGVLPGLNLTNDPRLEELRKRAEQMISGIDAQDLRDVRSVRANVAKQAEAIQDAMAGFMS